MGICAKWAADASTLCCHLKPADVRGSCNSETIQPRKCSAVLVPNTLVSLTQVLHHSNEVLWLPHWNRLPFSCLKENLACGLGQNVWKWPNLLSKDRKVYLTWLLEVWGL